MVIILDLLIGLVSSAVGGCTPPTQTPIPSPVDTPTVTPTPEATPFPSACSAIPPADHIGGTPTRVVPPPAAAPSAAPTNVPPSSAKTGIIFVVDRTISIGKQLPTDTEGGYCDSLPEQQILRYQIPEFFISLMAAY